MANHSYEVRSHKDKRGVDLISNALAIRKRASALIKATRGRVALRKLRESNCVSSRISHAVLFTREDLRSWSAVSPRTAFVLGVSPPPNHPATAAKISSRISRIP